MCGKEQAYWTPPCWTHSHAGHHNHIGHLHYNLAAFLKLDVQVCVLGWDGGKGKHLLSTYSQRTGKEHPSCRNMY